MIFSGLDRVFDVSFRLEKKNLAISVATMPPRQSLGGALPRRVTKEVAGESLSSRTMVLLSSASTPESNLRRNLDLRCRSITLPLMPVMPPSWSKLPGPSRQISWLSAWTCQSSDTVWTCMAYLLPPLQVDLGPALAYMVLLTAVPGYAELVSQPHSPCPNKTRRRDRG